MAEFRSSDHVIIGVIYWILRKIVGPIIRILLISKISGIQHIPKNGSAILAFNHQSFFDFICFASIAPRNIHFLSAEKFFEHRLWRIIMRLTGQIRVDRKENNKQYVYDQVNRHVILGSLIGIFPEGTRSPHKNEMLKAFTGVAHFALKHKIPIIPIGIMGTYDVMAKHDSYPNIRKIVEIHVGLPLYFYEHHGKENDHDVRIMITEKVMKELENLSGKKYKHYESIIVS